MCRKRWAMMVLLTILLLGLFAPRSPLLASRSTLYAPRSPQPLGGLFTPPDRGRVQMPRFEARSTSSSAVDLSADLPPVGNQGAQPSCVAWPTAYYLKTYQEKREWGWAVQSGGFPVYEHVFSPAYVFNQIYVEYSGGVGAYVGDALELLVSQGCDPWSLFPYTDSDYKTQPTLNQRRLALPYQSEAYGAFFLGNIGDPRNPTLLNNDLQPLKVWLANGNPIVVVLPVYAEFDAPAGPQAIVNVPADTYSYRGGHAILLVGYQDDIGGTGVGGFKFVNSWSTAYGNGGYGYLTYAFVRQYVPEAWWMMDRTAQGPHTIYGHVYNVAGSPLPGTFLTIDDDLPVTTSSDGFYGWGGLAAGDVVVAPSKPDYEFDPEADWVSVGAEVLVENFYGTSTNPEPLDCLYVIDGGIGGTFTGDTTGAPFNVHLYSCATWNESGPEHIYRVVSNRTGTIRANLRILSANEDLDVFILAACDEATCLAAGLHYPLWGIDQATLENAPMGAYYVVVDGYNGAHGSYKLTIEVPWDRPYATYLPLVLRDLK